MSYEATHAWIIGKVTEGGVSLKTSRIPKPSPREVKGRARKLGDVRKAHQLNFLIPDDGIGPRNAMLQIEALVDTATDGILIRMGEAGLPHGTQTFLPFGEYRQGTSH